MLCYCSTMKGIDDKIKTLVATRGFHGQKSVVKEKLFSLHSFYNGSGTMNCFCMNDTAVLRVAALREILRYKSDSTVIIVRNCTPSVNNITKECNIQIFSPMELFVPFDTHKYIPPHVKLDDFKNEFFLKNVDVNCIPRIKCTDPIVKYYGYSRGDILKFYRTNVYYRIVAD